MTALRLILGSGSPRRAELLRRLGLEFEVRAPRDLEEPMDPREPGAGARAAAVLKARALALIHPELVLAADTVVALEGEVLGKPRDAQEAGDMLQRLSGKWHRVWTGLAVRRWDDWEERDLAETRVRFRRLREEEIQAYIATGEPLDKAGAYGIQGMGGLLVDRIEGSWSNVVGLPLWPTCRLLRAGGIPVLGVQ